jgi:hypothetical protein
MVKFGRRDWIKAATLAVLAPSLSAYGQVRDRSVLDDLPRLLDELDLPQMPERQSQLGFEVRSKEFVVVARTSMEDARHAAKQMQQSWKRAGDLADHWSTVHRRPSFGIGALQLVISDDPVRENDRPPVTLNVVGIQTQIALNVAPGQPTLTEQLPRLREATAWAFLHTAQFDDQFPAWVCTGLANYAAIEGTPVSGQVQELLPHGQSLGGLQWRGKRIEPGQLEMPSNHRDQSALEVRYLLEGNDAQLAPQFFAALRQTVRGADRYWAEERRDSIRQAQQDLKSFERSINQFASSHEAEYKAWLKNPEMGQPILKPIPGSSPELAELQKQMATVLKLARRFGSEARSQSKVRVASFDAERRIATLDEPTPVLRSVDDLYGQLTDPKLPEWATLGSDDRLLFSNQQDKIRKLLGVDRGLFQASQRKEHWVLSAEIDYRTRLQAWLEENERDATRPVAKFAQVDAQTGQLR